MSIATHQQAIHHQPTNKRIIAEQAWRDFVEFVEAAAAGNTSAIVGAMEKMQAAGTTIETHAKATCNIDMS